MLSYTLVLPLFKYNIFCNKKYVCAQDVFVSYEYAALKDLSTKILSDRKSVSRAVHLLRFTYEYHATLTHLLHSLTVCEA